jgi:hypothetical protein
MLAQSQLVDLYRAHRDDSVLSVYLDTDQRDFAERSKWRVTLKNRLSEERRLVSDSTAFDRARDRLERRLLTDDNGFIEGRGWAGFATADECIYTEALPVPMPDLVRWETGLRVAPYARALKQSRPVLAILIDSRRAAVHRYYMGALSGGARLEVDTDVGGLTDVSVAKRATERTGVRGMTAADAAQRLSEVERDRLVARAAEDIRLHAGNDGVVVVGGADRVVSSLCQALADLGEHRVFAEKGLTFDMTSAELRERLELVASEISAADQARTLREVIAGARAGGGAELGQDRVERALVEKRVRTLIVSDGLRAGQPDRADHLEGAAFEQWASVVEVSRDAGTRLDREGEGVGALLRYRVHGDDVAPSGQSRMPAE